MFYVYQITGPTGIYIGKTNDLDRRWAEHRHNKRTRGHLQHAWAKYGASCFALEAVAQARTEEDILACEVAVIAQHMVRGDRLYNKTTGGEGTSGRIATTETRQKMSQSIKAYASEEAKPLKQRISTRQSGRTVSDSTKQKISAANKGRKLSDATRARMSAARAGMTSSPETIAKRAASHKGWQPSEETRKRMSEGAKRRQRLRDENGRFL